MNFFQLKAFCAVAHRKNMSLAAEDLFVSQSCLSKTIRSLEDELDIILFTRGRDGMSLTSAGQYFSEAAESLLHQYDTLLGSIAKYQLRKTDTLSIAMTTSQCYYHLLEPVKGFQLQYPGISVLISESEKDTIFKLLDNHSIDLAITWIDQYSPFSLDNYAVNCFKKEQRCLLVSANHPLAHKESLSLSEAQSYPFVLPSNTLQNIIYKQICLKNGFTPKVNTCYTSIHTQVELVAQGFGVSIIMKSMADYYSDYKVKAIDLDPPIYNLLAVVTNKNEPNRLVHKFIDYYLDFIKKENEGG